MLRYYGVTKDVEMKSVILQVKRFIEEQKLLETGFTYMFLLPVHLVHPSRIFLGMLRLKPVWNGKGLWMLCLSTWKGLTNLMLLVLNSPDQTLFGTDLRRNMF